MRGSSSQPQAELARGSAAAGSTKTTCLVRVVRDRAGARVRVRLGFRGRDSEVQCTSKSKQVWCVPHLEGG